MNLSDAFKITSDAGYAVSQAMNAAQLLLSRKRQEREARHERYEQIVSIMEAEAKATDEEIADLERLIFGDRTPEPTAAEVAEHEAETEREAA